MQNSDCIAVYSYIHAITEVWAEGGWMGGVVDCGKKENGNKQRLCVACFNKAIQNVLYKTLKA